MTHRCVTRRHFPPLLSLSEADTRMGQTHPLTSQKHQAAAKTATYLFPLSAFHTGTTLPVFVVPLWQPRGESLNIPKVNNR